MNNVIRDRVAAGRELARVLIKQCQAADVLVLALPRGGVPVAAEIAHALRAALDIMVVRKLGTPGQEELAMGAIASGGVRVLNDEIVSGLAISDEIIEKVAPREQAELERRMKTYRGSRPWPAIKGKHVILVDDGIATGATMRAAIAALRKQAPARVMVAVPVAPIETIARLRREADEVVCIETPEPFGAISRWYSSFPQLSDAEVRRILLESWAERDKAALKSRAEPAPYGNLIANVRTREDGSGHSLPILPCRVTEVRIAAGPVTLEGILNVPQPAHGLIVFVHGSGSSRFSERNRYVAGYLNGVGLATLLFDLLTLQEQEADERTGKLRFDIGLLTGRLKAALKWVGTNPEIASLPIGLFGASTGAAAALAAAAKRTQQVRAVVSRGGRPDLAPDSLALVRAPTLLIVGGLDEEVIDINQQAAASLKCEHRLEIVAGASHLFEERGKLMDVAHLARGWFEHHLQTVAEVSKARATAPGLIKGSSMP